MVECAAFRSPGYTDPLNICLLTYRGNPTCGGQGVYIDYLSRALVDLGHNVDVISGPPYPELAGGIGLHKLPNLDLYNPDHLFKPASLSDLLTSPINQLELLGMSSGGFPEPFTFGLRTYNYFRKRCRTTTSCMTINVFPMAFWVFIISVFQLWQPFTIRSPLTEMWKSGQSVLCSRNLRREGGIPSSVCKRGFRDGFLILLLSRNVQRGTSAGIFKTSGRKFRVVPNGINADFFYPLPHVKRSKNHIIVTNSADTPLKGLRYLLEAIASIKRERKIKLTVVGKPKKNGMIEGLVRKLGIRRCVEFTGRIEYEEFAYYYAKATIAVIPSLYEGFGMPAGEAMACGVPVISTMGGALPEVVGDAGILVPTADSKALEHAIVSLLDDPARRCQLGMAGLERVKVLYLETRGAENR